MQFSTTGMDELLNRGTGYSLRSLGAWEDKGSMFWASVRNTTTKKCKITETAHTNPQETQNDQKQTQNI